ncbi:UTP--glucose-1-phosphate uridylyltransferase [Desmospora profundinema]|uniref:UTP--glucose-1-phosphate uridylyltransferase n=1 Tax=Desmospora profundinema TaxID=1571184 RepID=A0ABU1IIK4_9BACL|nr:UTP--glucose-1-phosphate uridylyltransferase [Desmospora profundinema]MDR6224603.1 UTP--glucose-1-phosphate uridylyltransferase [Desmospora profundinema]
MKSHPKKEKGRIRKAVIPAAGFGTRSLPLTKTVPKEMFPISGKPAIHYIIEEAEKSGIEEILMIVSRSRNLIIDYFDRSPELEAYLVEKKKEHLLNKLVLPKVQIQYVRQLTVNGLGDAIRLAKSFVGEDPFAVLLPDDIILSNQKPGLAQLVNVYSSYQSNVIALHEVKWEELKNYGVIGGKPIESGVYRITDIIEKPETSPPSNLAVIGRYILKPSIFYYLERLAPGSGGEIQLTDAIKAMLQDEKCMGKICSGERYDIGKERDYAILVNRLCGG